ncbi:unknown [Crocosphaera subtropica ATCC 51142]|uniref:Glycosyltransferase RgtA/B/C/D-like domain-containing protein n=1 Tax=Crocosphaera subtropica (strain ATCC 51142 / BH68) TaxID=43989 RepID=B1WWB6_CROS5|nr:hypothetical protein [Crocosphaera subtropica]ACB54044.1 unknown [Crocosphaera subtropica ATCC 51142]
MKKNLRNFGKLLLILSLAYGVFILSFVVLNFTNYSGDQINDAYRVMAIWEGSWPTLGPGPAAWSGLVGDVYLPPLYYYLVFPGTLLTPDLSAQAISNALFTFLTIPLLAFTIYRLLEGVEKDKRFFLSALSGFWYILLFRNIVMSTGDSLGGNPVSIPFFLLCLVILYDYQLNEKLSPKLEVLCWITYGLVIAIITNLHFSALYVISAVSIISIIYYIFQNRKKKKGWILPGLAILTTLVTLTPYWIGEFGRNWINTQRIIQLVFDSSTEEGHSVSLLQRFQAIFSGYIDLGQGVYFIGNSSKSLLISIIFLLLILVISIYKFKGNKTIFYSLFIIWGVFLLAYSSTDLEKTYNPVFYKILIYLAPIFLTMCSLAYLDFSKKLEKILIGFIIICITISLLINIQYFANYISSRGGMPRVPNTSDISQALEKIPPQSTVCHPQERYRNIRNQEYINQYVNQQDLTFVAECEEDFYLLYPKYESLGDYRLKKTKSLSKNFQNFNHQYKLFEETPLFDIYQIN